MSMATRVLLDMPGAANTAPVLREEDTPVGAAVTPAVEAVTAKGIGFEKARYQRAFLRSFLFFYSSSSTNCRRFIFGRVIRWLRQSFQLSW